MSLNSHLSPLSCTISAMMHMYGAPDGGNVVCQCVWIAAMSLTTHIKPHHAPLSQPFKVVYWRTAPVVQVLKHISKHGLIKISTTVKWENLAEIKFHWLANLKVFAHLMFTIQWQVSSISLLKVNILEAFNFQGFASSAEIAKNNRTWNFSSFTVLKNINLWFYLKKSKSAKRVFVRLCVCISAGVRVGVRTGTCGSPGTKTTTAGWPPASTSHTSLIGKSMRRKLKQ